MLALPASCPGAVTVAMPSTSWRSAVNEEASAPVAAPGAVTLIQRLGSTYHLKFNYYASFQDAVCVERRPRGRTRRLATSSEPPEQRLTGMFAPRPCQT